MRALDERLGRLRELRYLALYVLGMAFAALLAVLITRVAADGGWPWDRELSGGILVGGMALSAQVAKGRARQRPLRTLVLVISGIAIGVLGAALLR
jgi:hypothetical protein